MGKNAPGYTSAMFERVQILLSDVFLGFYLVPSDQVWNYNFMGIKHSTTLKYDLILNVPKEFYHEIHR